MVLEDVAEADQCRVGHRTLKTPLSRGSVMEQG